MGMIALVLFVLVLGAALVLVLWFVGVYNRLVQLKNNVERSWSNIDVMLKQRFDELPKLIDTCKGYMKHEQDTFQKITEARSRVQSAGSLPERALAENQLTGALRSLFAVAENYPELKANTNFMQLQGRISDIESNIASRRDRFNEDTKDYNVRIEVIPDVFVARILGYQKKPLFEATEQDRQDVKVSFA